MLKNQRDFVTGLLFAGFGAAFAWAASLHEIGWPPQMGPGFFPLVLATLLILLGGWLVFKALTLESESGGPLGAPAWRALAGVLLPIVLLGLWAWARTGG